MSPQSREAANILQGLTSAARTAGEYAHRFFRHGRTTKAEVSYKNGGSPVTSADIEANRLLHEALTGLFPDAAWLSEESADSSERISKDDVLIVDPIDGTRAFAAGDARWAVCAAYIRQGQPLAGVIFAPAYNEFYCASAGAGALFNGERITPRLDNFKNFSRAMIAGPASMVEPIAKTLGHEAGPKTPSLALRFAAVARGTFIAATAAPAAYDWDIAAADIILRESGCALSEIDGRALEYNRSAIRRAALFAAPEKVLPPLLTAARQAELG